MQPKSRSALTQRTYWNCAGICQSVCSGSLGTFVTITGYGKITMSKHKICFGTSLITCSDLLMLMQTKWQQYIPWLFEIRQCVEANKPPQVNSSHRAEPVGDDNEKAAQRQGPNYKPTPAGTKPKLRKNARREEEDDIKKGQKT